MGFNFSQTELINLAVEINRFAPPLTDLQLTKPRIGRFLGGGALHRCIDSDTLGAISSMGVNDSLGHLGELLAQVSHSTLGSAGSHLNFVY